MLTITRDEFKAAIEAGISKTSLDPDVAKALRAVGETATKSAVGSFVLGDTGCPAEQAETWPQSMNFAIYFDRHMRRVHGVGNVQIVRVV